MPLILNLGAGSVSPMRKATLANIDELRDSDIINLDIYNQIVPYSPDGATTLFPGADIRYSDVQRAIGLGDNTVDMALAMSPYGYAVLNAEVYRVLKPNGVVLVMGSQRNKYVTKMNFLCEGTMAARFFDLFEVIPPNDLALRCIAFLAERGSRVSSGAQATKIDFFGIYRKL